MPADRPARGRVVAVWGSPRSGKSTLAVKLGTAVYDRYESAVIVLLTDLETPMIPVVFPRARPEDVGSVGVPLSGTEVETDAILRNLVTFRNRRNLGFLGYREGENRNSYPKFGRAKAADLLASLRELADLVVVDCVSNPEVNPLASACLELADRTIRLATPDLACLSYLRSQRRLYADSRYRPEKQLLGLNTPDADVCPPIEEARALFPNLAFVLPYCRRVREQAQSGALCERTGDRRFERRLAAIAERAVGDDAD